MRILVTVDPEIPVPPLLYGGVERLVEGVLYHYTSKNHEVALVANKKSTSVWPLEIFPWPSSSSRGFRNTWSNAWYLKKCISKFKPDVVHSFSRLMYMYPTFLTSKTPFLQTYGRYISKKSTLLANLIGGKRIAFTCCGKHMIREELKFKEKFECVYNFTQLEKYDIREGSNYLLYLGRIQDIKGTYEAIQVAKKTNNKLIIAGNIQPGHDAYFEQSVAPFLNEDIEYVGSVDDNKKRQLFKWAKAFLFPIKWEEPFGMVMVEAMASGIPVIAFRRGAVPEIIENGINGFVVDNLEEMVLKVVELDSHPLNKEKIRAIVQDRFSLETIGEHYLKKLFEWS